MTQTLQPRSEGCAPPADDSMGREPRDASKGCIPGGSCVERAARSSPFKASSGASRRRPRRARRVPVPSRAGRTAAAAAAPLRARAGRRARRGRWAPKMDFGPSTPGRQGPRVCARGLPRARRRGRGRRRVVLGQIPTAAAGGGARGRGGTGAGAGVALSRRPAARGSAPRRAPAPRPGRASPP